MKLWATLDSCDERELWAGKEPEYCDGLWIRYNDDLRTTGESDCKDALFLFDFIFPDGLKPGEKAEITLTMDILGDKQDVNS